MDTNEKIEKAAETLSQIGITVGMLIEGAERGSLEDRRENLLEALREVQKNIRGTRALLTSEPE